ncbi:major capsid protein [uncultured Mediterranean phage uvDeep-CGR2-KM18-C269]|nr:major capsid protein [uncultured Mediterranean phage uvDeep-CGR2-KM18-C269]
MAEVTTTTAANFIPELWRDAILDYAERKFQIRNQVMDFSSLMADGGDILHIPKVTEETAATLSSGNAVTYGANTDGVINLTVDQHAYEAKRIGDHVRIQESADLFNAYAKSMGYAIAKYIENYLAVSVIQGGTGNDVTLGADNTFTTAKLREGLQSLLDAGHDYADGETYLYCSPAMYMSALSLQDFYDASRRGDAQNPAVSGAIGSVYGMPTFVSTDWDDDGGTGDETASIFKKESVYMAMQLSPRVQSAYDIDYLSTSVVVDVLFGAILSHAASSTSLGVVNFNNP